MIQLNEDGINRLLKVAKVFKLGMIEVGDGVITFNVINAAYTVYAAIDIDAIVDKKTIGEKKYIKFYAGIPTIKKPKHAKLCLDDGTMIMSNNDVSVSFDLYKDDDRKVKPRIDTVTRDCGIIEISKKKLKMLDYKYTYFIIRQKGKVCTLITLDDTGKRYSKIKLELDESNDTHYMTSGYNMKDLMRVINSKTVKMIFRPNYPMTVIGNGELYYVAPRHVNDNYDINKLLRRVFE